MLSKAASSTIFWVFSMTQPGIEPQSPGPLANTLLIRPMVRSYRCIITGNYQKVIWHHMEYHHHHYQSGLTAWIHLTFSCYLSLWAIGLGRSSRCHPLFSERADECKFLLVSQYWFIFIREIRRITILYVSLNSQLKYLRSDDNTEQLTE